MFRNNKRVILILRKVAKQPQKKKKRLRRRFLKFSRKFLPGAAEKKNRYEYS